MVCVISGLLMGTFAPFVTRALTAGHPLTPYSIAVFFTLAALLSSFVFNVTRYIALNLGRHILVLVGAVCEFEHHVRFERFLNFDGKFHRRQLQQANCLL